MKVKERQKKNKFTQKERERKSCVLGMRISVNIYCLRVSGLMFKGECKIKAIFLRGIDKEIVAHAIKRGEFKM